MTEGATGCKVAKARCAATYDTPLSRVPFSHHIKPVVDPPGLNRFVDGETTPRVTRFVAADGVCIWRRVPAKPD